MTNYNALLTTRNLVSTGILIVTSLLVYSTLDAQAHAVNNRVYTEIIALAGDDKDKDKDKEAAAIAIKTEREKSIPEADRTKFKDYLAKFKNTKIWKIGPN